MPKTIKKCREADLYKAIKIRAFEKKSKLFEWFFKSVCFHAKPPRASRKDVQVY